MYYLIALIVILLGIGIFVWWKKSRSSSASEHQMLSFVALLKEPQRIEPIYIATAARKAWGADLGIGEEEGPDGFVVGEPPMPTIIVKYNERVVMVNNFPSPYVDDPEAAAASIPDLRLRKLVAEHTAWISCDAMGVEDFDDLNEVRQWYRLLGPLLSELVDDNCLAIMLPQTGQIFAHMDETLEKLKSDDPLEALQDDAPVPVVPISGDDPRMIAAVKEARDKFPIFVAAFEQRAGENFGVKAPISGGGNTEFIWLTVTAIENNVIYGELANEPMSLGDLKHGSKVRTSVSDLNDWAFIANGKPQGMFTVKVLAEARREEPDDES